MAGSVESGLDLDEISPDLAGSGGFHVDRSRKSKNIAGISHFLSEILRMSPDVVDLVVGSGGSGFGGGNLPTDPKGLGFVGGDPQPTVGLVGSGGGRRVGRVMRTRGHPYNNSYFRLNWFQIYHN